MERAGDEFRGTVEDSSGVAIGSHIKQDANTSNGNVVNLNFTPDEWFARLQQQTRGGLSVEASQALWQTIAELNNVIGGLKTSVDTNARATEKLEQRLNEEVQALQRIARSINGMGIQIPEGSGEQVFTTKQVHWWQYYVTPVLLVLILVTLVVFLATGGQFP